MQHLKEEFWKYADNFELMRDAIQLRYSLVPYIYTASRNAYDSGVSICRPMYYGFPEKQESNDFKNQYMFGNEMIVRPNYRKS